MDTNEDLAYVAYMDAEFAAQERELQEERDHEMWQEWRAARLEDDPETPEEELTMEAFADWSCSEMERRDEDAAERWGVRY